MATQTLSPGQTFLFKRLFKTEAGAKNLGTNNDFRNSGKKFQGAASAWELHRNEGQHYGSALSPTTTAGVRTGWPVLDSLFFKINVLPDSVSSRRPRRGRKVLTPRSLIALLFGNLFGNIWACSCKLPFNNKTTDGRGDLSRSSPGLNGMLTVGAGLGPRQPPPRGTLAAARAHSQPWRLLFKNLSNFLCVHQKLFSLSGLIEAASRALPLSR